MFLPYKMSIKLKESNPEYAKVTIIISTPDSNIPTKILQSRIDDNINIDELKRLEIKKRSDNIEGVREKQNRQENIGMCIVFVFMVSLNFLSVINGQIIRFHQKF